MKTQLPAKISAAQFDAIAKLISLRTGPAKESARLALCDGVRQVDAAQRAGCKPDAVSKTIRRIRNAVALAGLAVAPGVCSSCMSD